MTIVADNDYLVYQWVRSEISNCIRDAGLIVVGGERHNQTRVGDRVVPHLQLRGTLILKQQEQVHYGQAKAEHQRHPAVPDDPFVESEQSFAAIQQVAWQRDQHAE
jgi:hypothetical protein